MDQANKLLRFAKANADVGLNFGHLGELSELCMIALSDAAWGVRRNSESQGGYFVLLMNKKALQGHMDQPYIILDWRSFKLPRISRSSLNSEAQACSAAMDALEYLLIFWHGCVNPDFNLRNLDTQEISMESALVIDANALFDSIKAEVPQLQGDKRTKIEVMIVKEKMEELKTKLKWISSETQLADGVTKLAARQLLADRLRTHLFSLQSDKSFQAAKKKTQAERLASARRNAIGRTLPKASLGYIVLTNHLVPVKAEGLVDHDYFIEMIFTMFVIIFSMMLWFGFRAILQCFQSMSRFLRRSIPNEEPLREPEPSDDQINLEDLPLPLGVIPDGVRERVPDAPPGRSNANTQTPRLANNEFPLWKIKQMQERLTYQTHEILMLRQQRDEKEAEVERLTDVCNYLQGDLGATPLWVSKTGDKFHLSPECHGLANANTTNMRRLSLCQRCIDRLHERHGAYWGD